MTPRSTPIRWFGAKYQVQRPDFNQIIENVGPMEPESEAIRAARMIDTLRGYTESNEIADDIAEVLLDVI